MKKYTHLLKPRGRTFGFFLTFFLILGNLQNCSSNQIRYFFHSDEWEAICGCLPKEKSADSFSNLVDALGNMELGALWRVGKDNYLTRLYNGVKKAYEFEKVEFTSWDKEEALTLGIDDAKAVIHAKKQDFYFMKIIEVGVDHKSDLLIYSSDDFFPGGSANITKFGEYHLLLVKQALINYPESVLRVQVHLNIPNNEKASKNLSEKRAKAIAANLQDGGFVKAKRFRQVAGMAGEKTLPDSAPSNIRANRVEIYFETPEENEIDTYQFNL